MLGWGVVQAQVAVVAPSLELQEAMNHAEQLQQMVQTYQTMVNVKDGINKGIDAVEKVNNKLATIRDVQEIATRSAACVGRIKQVYEMIGNLRLDVQYTTSLVDLCNQVTRECIDVTAYGAQVFSDRFLVMSDAERLAETRKVLDDLDRLLQGGMIYLQKKNNPAKDIWEDLSWVFLGGLFVYLFPELIRFMETLVNALMPIELHADSAIAEFMKESNLGDGSVPPPDSSTSFGNILMNAFLKSGTGQNAAGYLIAQGVLKPFADLVNYLCFPTFLTIRAVGLKVIYWSAPLILVLGAMSPFRSLWKQWFMIYIALLACSPMLYVADSFCEECFRIYASDASSPILGFFMIAMARFKAYQSVMELSYKLFRM